MDKLEIISRIGYGSYGNVWKATNNGKLFALKQNIKRKHVVGTSVIRELSTLSLFKHHPNIVSLEKVYTTKPCNIEKFILQPDDMEDEIYFLFELSQLDLMGFIYSLNSPVHLILKIIADIALGLEYMHSCGYIHRDLKPANILLKIESKKIQTQLNKYTIESFKNLLMDLDQTKITAILCDLGFSKRYTNENRPSTPGVVTIYYRPPEVIKKDIQTDKLDVWAVGMMLYEMLYISCIYRTASDNDEKELLSNIIRKRPSLTETEEKYLGLNTNYVTTGLPPIRQDFTDQGFIDSNRKRRIEELVGDLDNIEDILKGTLNIDPNNRMSITEFLDHPLFDKIRFYIQLIRSKVKLTVPRTYIKVTDHMVKTAGYKYFDILYSMLIKTKKVKNDIIFTALDIYLKYINIIELDNMSDNNLFVIVVTCFYISYKYHQLFIDEYGTNFIYSCFNLVPNEIDNKAIETIEKDILIKFDFQIYSDNIYTLIIDKNKINIDELYEIFKNFPPNIEIDPLEYANMYLLSSSI